jgi:hypothetical protein
MPVPPPPPPSPLSDWFIGLQPRRINITHNTFRDIGQKVMTRGAAFMEGASSCIIAHNRVESTPRYAFGSNSAYKVFNSRDNLLEYNVLRSINLLTMDTGAIEALGSGNPDDSPSPWFTNTTIRYNTISNTVGCSLAAGGERVASMCMAT